MGMDLFMKKSRYGLAVVLMAATWGCGGKEVDIATLA